MILDGLYKQYQSIEPWLKNNSTKKQLKYYNQKKKELNLMEHMNVLCVHAAQLLALVIGGMVINI